MGKDLRNKELGLGISQRKVLLVLLIEQENVSFFAIQT